MTLFWLWVSAGCLAAALCGFTASRLAVRSLATPRAAPADSPRLRPPPPREREVVFVPVALTEPVAKPPAPTTSRAHARASAPPRRIPPPTAPEPGADKLALWARQVRAGERKMSIASDGCRVTWNRTCKHGHPSWLVRLGYLEATPPVPRHNPR